MRCKNQVAHQLADFAAAKVKQRQETMSGKGMFETCLEVPST